LFKNLSFEQFLKLKKQDKMEEYERIMKSMPIPPYLAKWAKKRPGAGFPIKQGYNLSEAEADHGSGWLNK
jgi:hypothetical protein